MLSAHVVCATLNAEHAMVRRALASLDDLLCEVNWRNSLAVRERIGGMLQFLANFEATCHGPKAQELRDMMRGRSPQADRLIADMEQLRLRVDQHLLQATQRLDEMVSGNVSQADRFVEALERYRSEMLHHLQLEENSLQPLAKDLLDDDEWARIASDVSWLPTTPMPYSDSASPVLASGDSVSPATPSGGIPRRWSRRPRFQPSSWT
jgi:hemerythrin-like domain-containing protein